jgi:hypothetical protein
MVYSLLVRPFSMQSISKIRKPSPGTNPLSEPDYSVYTFVELFRARYWIDIELARQSSLEDEIQKRCEHIRERINGKAWAAAGSTTPFRPYGLICGVVFLCFSIGPFVSVRFLNMINLIKDVNGDKVSLSGLWALLMLPVVVIVSMIGGRMDAERVINWFHLDGRKEDANKRSLGATINTL